MKGAYSLVSGLYVGALRKLALERQQDLHEQEEEKKREGSDDNERADEVGCGRMAVKSSVG